MDNNKIGKFIAKLRKEKNLTQQQLGDKLFVTDKAVSKWERGLSLPDITILEKLAIELDTDIYSILQVENRNNVDVSQVLNKERIKIKKQLYKKVLTNILPIIILNFIVLFKLIPFGYEIVPVRYDHTKNKLINLGVPKFSFLYENNQDSYSYKSFRGKNILKNELKSFVNTLEHISCNNTTYYYDTTNDITIIDYYVKERSFYNSISYNVRNGNYCNYMEITDYTKALGELNSYHTLYAEESNLIVNFFPRLQIKDTHNEWTASLDIYYHDTKTKKIIEMSTGTFKIINDELIYYRNKINIQDPKINIPNISTFVIKNKKLILKENYLSEYKKGIILK